MSTSNTDEHRAQTVVLSPDVTHIFTSVEVLLEPGPSWRRPTLYSVRTPSLTVSLHRRSHGSALD